MSFDKLISKVKQAEDALEAQERRVAADVRQLKASWRAGWTPGRIVIAGLTSGFLIGRAEPLRNAAKGGNLVQIVTMLSGLFAGGSAQAAASEAHDAARNAEHVADAVTPAAMEAEAMAREAVTVHAARSAVASTES